MRSCSRLYLLALVALAAPVIAQRSCRSDELNCNACPSKDTLGNMINALPRYNRDGTEVNSNPGWYNLLQCKVEAEGASGNCSTLEFSDALDSPDKFGDSTTDEKDPVNYVQGLAIYFALPIIGFLIPLIFIPCFICFRYCCCCAKGCSTCGKKYPNQGGCCCCAGYTIYGMQAGDQAPTTAGAVYKMRYSRCQRLCARMCMLYFVVSVLVLTALGYFKGVTTVKDSVVDLTTAVDPLVDITFGLQPVFTNFTARMVGMSFVAGLSGLNATVQSVVPIQGLYSNALCVKEAVIDKLPDPADLIDLVDRLEGSIDGLPDYAATRKVLVDLNVTVAELPVIIPALNASLDQIRPVIPVLEDPALSTDLRSLNASVNKLRPFPSSINDTLTKLNALPTGDELAGSGPDSVKSRLADMAGGVRGNRNDTGQGITFRSTVVSDMQSAKSKLAALPNMTMFASELEELDGVVVEVNGTMVSISHTLDKLQSALDALPDLDSMIGELRRAEELINAYDTQAVNQTLIQMRDAIDSLPSVDEVLLEVNRLRAVLDSRHCVNNLRAMATAINDTLVLLQAGAADVIDEIAKVNTTMADAEKTVNDLDEQLTDFNNTLNDLPDFNKYINDANAIAGDVDATRRDLNFTQLILDLESVKGQTNISFTGLRDTVNDLLDTLRNPDTRPSTTLISTVRDLDSTVRDLPSSLDSAIGAVQQFGKGFCTDSGGTTPTDYTFCTCDDENACLSGTNNYVGASSDCGAAQCNMMSAAQVGICNLPTDANAKLASGGDAPRCSQHSDCPSQDYYQCVSLSDDLGDVLTQLDEAKTQLSAVPSTSGTQAQLESMDASLDAVGDLDARVGEVDSVRASVESLPDLGEYQSKLTAVKDSLGGISDVSDVVDQWDSVNSTLDKLPDLAEVRTTLVDFNTTANDVPKDDLQDVVDILDDARQFLNEDLPYYLRELSYERLQGIVNAPADGSYDMEALTEHVVRIMDNITETFTTLKGNETYDRYADGKGVRDITQAMGRVQSRHARALGSLYYMMNVTDIATVVGGAGDRVFRDAQGRKWDDPDDSDASSSAAVCVTNDCIKEAARVYSEETMDDATGGDVPIPLSFENLMMLLYLPFVLLALLGLCACVCVKCNRWNPAVCMTLSGCVAIPWCMLFYGLLLMPFVFLIADGCQGQRDVIKQTLELSWAKYCDDAGALYINGSRCVFRLMDRDPPLTDIVVELDPVALYTDMASGCSLTEAGNSPFSHMYNSLKAGLPDLVTAEAEDFIDDPDLDARPRDPLRYVIFNTTDSIGANLVQFLVESEGVLNCHSMSSLFFSFQDSLCCEMFDSMAWTFVPIYLLVWVVFFCGTCAGIYGRKRFPSKLWGPSVRNNQRALQGDAEDAEDYYDDAGADVGAGAGAGNAYDAQMPMMGKRSRAAVQPAPRDNPLSASLSAEPKYDDASFQAYEMARRSKKG